MSETLEQRMRRLAKEDEATLCQVYPGDVVELLDERDRVAVKICTERDELLELLEKFSPVIADEWKG